jgi:hypothetical protein
MPINRNEEDSVCVCVDVANYKELIITERRQKVRAQSSIGQREKKIAISVKH